jgi:3-hydroxyisobutyrate dehydrogenase
MAKIGFIGLGNMGGPMAANLVKAGHQVKVFDLSDQAIGTLVAKGAQGAVDVTACVQDVAVVISMLPASQHVESLYLGDDCLLKQIARDTLVIDSSTIAPESARKVAEAAVINGLPMIDAPVSGGTAGAEAGTLTFIVGGATEALETARPFLEEMGKNIFHAGDSGAGQVAKICNNMLLGVLMAGTAEALQLGVANGLDPKVLSDIMAQSSGRNWALELYNPYPGVMEGSAASRDYQGGFMVDLMSKDMGLAMQAAVSTQSSTPMGSLALSLYKQQQSKGKGQLDFSSIMQLFQQNGPL